MKKYKIGYTIGAFDMFHIGHLNLLRQAKEQCDYLIVGVSTDELVQHDRNKQPIIPFEERTRIVKAFRYVDDVVPQVDSNKLGAWQEFHFDAMFVGYDRQDTSQWEELERQARPLGVDVINLSCSDGFSSTVQREELPTHLEDIKVGYTQGTFDLFHYGHLNLIEHAKALCDYLIVGVNSDNLVQEYKHKTPVVRENERATIVAALKNVDQCRVVTTLNKMDAYSQFHFNTIFIGDDWRGNPRWERTKLEMEGIGVDLIFLPHTDGISTTQLSKSIKHE